MENFTLSAYLLCAVVMLFIFVVLVMRSSFRRKVNDLKKRNSELMVHLVTLEKRPEKDWTYLLEDLGPKELEKLDKFAIERLEAIEANKFQYDEKLFDRLVKKWQGVREGIFREYGTYR